MAVGLGVDIVEIDRMARILKKTPSFETRVFTQAEQDYCQSKAHPEIHYAARFAAKEAVCKALGTGIMVSGMHPRLIEVVRDKRGKPAVVLHGKAQEVANQEGVLDIPLSLTYTHSVAVANAVAITKSSRLEDEQRRDVKAELAAQFKEIRGMLDDLGTQTVQEQASHEASMSAQPSIMQEAQEKNQSFKSVEE